MNIKRRTMLSAGLASLSSLALAKNAVANTTESNAFDGTYDVIVIGTGAAGSSAAARASELGLKVLVLEKLRIGGGSTIICNGGFAICGTDIQKAKGIEDSPELFEKEMLQLGKVNDPVVVHRFVNETLPTYKWAKNLGVEFHDVTTGAGMSVPRQHMTKTPQMLKVFNDLAKKNGATFLYGTPAKRLITDSTGRVIGVQAEKGKKTLRFKALKGVVIAAGGWARSEDLLRRFSPKAEKAMKLGGLGNSGDGSKMAWALGADLLDVSYTKPTFGFNPTTSTSAFVMYNGAIIVNTNGERFVDESLPYKTLGEITLEQPNGLGIQVYDAGIHEIAQKDPLANTDYLKKNGELHQADTLQELAAKLGIPADNLTKAVAEYNRGIEKHADRFGRTSLTAGGGKLLPIQKAPFYGFKATSVLLSTYCGPKINENAQVISILGEPIPGLWAAGEGTGGIHGAAYMSGTSVGKAVVFGRLAAENIAAQK